MKLIQLIESTINEAEISNKLKKLIDELNKLIQQSANEDWNALEPDSTWEEVYEFEPIKFDKRYVHIVYREPFNNNKMVKEKYTFGDMGLIDNLRWVKKALNKGYREFKKGKYDD